MTVALSTTVGRPDGSDLALLRSDEGSAFRVFFERHVQAVHGYLCLRVGPDAANDLVSETFATAWRKRRSFRSDASDARPWLLGIASNIVGRHRTIEAKWARSVAAELASRGSDSDDLDSCGGIDGGLRRAIARLPQSERDVLLLIAVSEMAVSEAADHLGISTVAARVRLHRARRKVSSELERGNTR